MGQVGPLQGCARRRAGRMCAVRGQQEAGALGHTALTWVPHEKSKRAICAGTANSGQVSYQSRLDCCT